MWLIRLRALLKSVGREGLILFYALRHPATPRLLKLAIVGLGLYVLSPIDLIPDMLLVLGWADDAAALIFGVPFLVSRLPTEVLGDCRDAVERLLSRFGFAGR